MSVKSQCDLSYAAVEGEAIVKLRKAHITEDNKVINTIVTKNNCVIMQVNGAIVFKIDYSYEVKEADSNYYKGLPSVFVGYYKNDIYTINIVNTVENVCITSTENQLLRLGDSLLIINYEKNVASMFNIKGMTEKSIKLEENMKIMKISSTGNSTYGLIKNDTSTGIYKMENSEDLVFTSCSLIDAKDLAVTSTTKDNGLVIINYGIVDSDGNFFYSSGSTDMKDFCVYKAEVEKVESVNNKMLLYSDNTVYEFIIDQYNGFYLKDYQLSFDYIPNEVHLIEVFQTEITINIPDDESYSLFISCKSEKSTQEIVYKDKVMHLSGEKVLLTESVGRSVVNFYLKKEEYYSEILELELHCKSLSQYKFTLDVNESIFKGINTLPREKLQEIKQLDEKKLDAIADLQKHMRKNVSLKNGLSGKGAFRVVISADNKISWDSGPNVENYIKNRKYETCTSIWDKLKDLVKEIERGIKKIGEWILDGVKIIIDGIEYLINSVKEMVSGFLALMASFGAKVRQVLELIIDLFNFKDIFVTSQGVDSFITNQLNTLRETILPRFKNIKVDDNLIKELREDGNIKENIDKISGKKFYGGSINDNNYIQNTLMQEVSKTELTSILNEPIKKLMTVIKDNVKLDEEEEEEVKEKMIKTFEGVEVDEHEPFKTIGNPLFTFFSSIKEICIKLVCKLIDSTGSIIVDAIESLIKELQSPIPIITPIMNFLMNNKKDFTYISLFSLIISFPLTVANKLIHKRKTGPFIIEVDDRNKNGFSYSYKDKYITRALSEASQAVSYVISIPEWNFTKYWNFFNAVVNIVDILFWNSWKESTLSIIIDLLAVGCLIVFPKTLGNIASLALNILSRIVIIKANVSYLMIANYALGGCCVIVDSINEVYKLPWTYGLKIVLHVSACIIMSIISISSMKMIYFVKKHTYLLCEDSKAESISIYEAMDTLDDYYEKELHDPVTFPNGIQLYGSEASLISLIFNDKFIPIESSHMYSIEMPMKIQLGYDYNNRIIFLRYNEHECGNRFCKLGKIMTLNYKPIGLYIAAISSKDEDGKEKNEYLGVGFIGYKE